MENPPIYTITSLSIEDGKMRKGICRNVGFYYDLKEAKRCVEEDWAHFDESGYYNHIVIELTMEGLYNINGIMLDQKKEWWYRHNWNERRWVKTKKPQILKGIINFGLG
jgi:hypothetical protein